MEADSHNLFFPFSYSSLVGKSIPEQDYKLLTCLDERIEHCQITYSFNALEGHASVFLRRTMGIIVRLVYPVFTIIPYAKICFKKILR